MSNDRLGAVGVLSDLIDVDMIDCQRKRGRFRFNLSAVHEEQQGRAVHRARAGIAGRDRVIGGLAMGVKDFVIENGVLRGFGSLCDKGLAEAATLFAPFTPFFLAFTGRPGSWGWQSPHLSMSRATRLSVLRKP